MHESEIYGVLNSFSPISLEKMNKVRLMNRTDKKYVFPVSRLPEMLSLLPGGYRIMEIDQLRAFPYLTTYLDTPDFLFYNQHLTGKLERFKIRFRKYESTDISYLEIKKKTNKGRTEKLRIVNTPEPEVSDDRAISFITLNTPVNPDILHPVLITRFTRTTLVSLETGERITFDYNLTFGDLDNKRVDMPFLAIAELKKEGFSNQTLFPKVAKSLGIRPAGFSKYCMGCHFLYDLPRQNLLKRKMLLINKIENEYSQSVCV